jgi:hypothetical protein
VNRTVACDSALLAVTYAETITATFGDGPLADRSVEAEVVEGRQPKTLDLPADDGTTCRYCLEGWMQQGQTAAYTFLYRI